MKRTYEPGICVRAALEAMERDSWDERRWAFERLRAQIKEIEKRHARERAARDRKA